MTPVKAAEIVEDNDDSTPFDYFKEEPKPIEVLKTPTEQITVQYKEAMSSAEKSKVRKPLRQFKEKEAIEGFVSCAEEDSDVNIVCEEASEKVTSFT